MPKNKYFYYSEKDCQYVEVKRSFASMAGRAVAVLGLSVLLTVFFVKLFGTKLANDAKQQQLESEVMQLSDKLNKAMAALEKLSESDVALRRAVNLPQASAEEKSLGVGGARTSAELSNAPSSLISASSKLIDWLARQVEAQSASYEEIVQKYEQNKQFFACVPAIKPVQYEKSSPFGMRFHPIYRVMKFHSGQDFHAPMGTDVYATGDGVVERAAFADGYGNVVVINHGFGYRSIYAHLSRFNVKVDQKVKRGDIIAWTGNTGVSDAPHLHYEISRDGVKVNPAEYFFDESPKEYVKALANATPVPDSLLTTDGY
jgi:murein DD-endopeptidase MepM/ murein hydrolase activator NlpD